MPLIIKILIIIIGSIIVIVFVLAAAWAGLALICWVGTKWWDHCKGILKAKSRRNSFVSFFRAIGFSAIALVIYVALGLIGFFTPPEPPPGYYWVYTIEEAGMFICLIWWIISATLPTVFLVRRLIKGYG